MKLRMQGMVMGVLVTVLLLGTITVWAATTQTIEVTFGNVRTTIFGQEFVVRDEQGLVIEPFIYNGRAYVPVDTVLHAMGANAQWNETTSTLNFGTVEQPAVARERVSLRQAAPMFSSSNGEWWSTVSQVNYVMMGGARHNDAITYRGPSNGTRTSFSLHNLNGEYNLLTGYFGRVDGTRTFVGTLRIIGDGNVLHTHEQGVNDLPTAISIPVQGVRSLRIEVTNNNSNGGPTFAFSGFVE